MLVVVVIVVQELVLLLEDRGVLGAEIEMAASTKNNNAPALLAAGVGLLADDMRCHGRPTASQTS